MAFLWRMKLFIFFFRVAFVHSELHTFLTTYTAIRGKTTAGTPEIFAATTLDGQQIGSYDSNKMMLVPKQDWVEEVESKTNRKDFTVIKENIQRIHINNIHALMETLPSDGVHTFQAMFGCWWDDKTKHSHGFDQYGYDGKDFITLDMNNSKYITSAPQAKSTMKNWNKDTKQLSELKYYYEDVCGYQAKDFVFFTEATFKKTVLTVTLLLKKPEAFVDCHVTGFLANNTVILWRNNGQDINSHALVKSGETLPNEDGTFQRKVTLNVPPDDRKNQNYSCVVKHMGETIQKILTEDEIKSNKLAGTSAGNASLIIVAFCFLVAVIIIPVVIYKNRTHIKANLGKGWEAVQALFGQQ